MRIFRPLAAAGPARNPMLLVYGSFFRAVTFSGPFLAIFLMARGLSASQILILEAILFSGFWVTWELPSGWVSDKIGHARSIQLSIPISALGFGLYAVTGEFWQFCVMEALIGIGQGLVSGSDSALLRESLDALDRSEEESKWQHRMNAASKASYAIGAVGSLAIVHWLGVAATLAIDGLVILAGLPIALLLTEVASSKQRTGNFRETLRKFMGNPEVRLVLQLSIGLGTVTYFAVWLTAIYYQQFLLTALVVGVMSAFKQALMVGLSLLQSRYRFNDRMWWWLIGLGGVATAAFVLPRSWWFIPVLLGFDIIRTIAHPVINTRLNDLIDGHYRASMHSVHTLLQRCTFVLLGLPVQWVISAHGINAAIVVSSCFGLCLAGTAVIGLRNHSLGR